MKQVSGCEVSMYAVLHTLTTNIFLGSSETPLSYVGRGGRVGKRYALTTDQSSALIEGVVVEAADCSIATLVSVVVLLSFKEPREAVICDKGLRYGDPEPKSRCSAGLRLLLTGMAFIGVTGVGRSEELL